MYSKIFWADAFERAVATAAQVLLVALGGQSFDKVADGLQVLALAALGGFALSIIKSLAASKIGDHSSASLLPEVTTYKEV
jgi:hypothetical protein